MPDRKVVIRDITFLAEFLVVLPATIFFGILIFVGLYISLLGTIERGFSFSGLAFLLYLLGGLLGIWGIWVSILTMGEKRLKVCLISGVLSAGYFIKKIYYSEPHSEIDLFPIILLSSLAFCILLGILYLFGYRNGT
jgi:hypothetical protein